MGRTAIMTNPWSAYGAQEERVRVARSKARCAGPNGVTFYAPGWRPMVYRDPALAIRKIESHPGFVRWEA